MFMFESLWYMGSFSHLLTANWLIDHLTVIDTEWLSYHFKEVLIFKKPALKKIVLQLIPVLLLSCNPLEYDELTKEPDRIYWWGY